MSTPEEVFRSFIERVLHVWSGYQIALDNSCGGDDTSEKAKWIVDVIYEYTTTTRGLKAEEMEDWLTNILYHDFDLILEDDSVYQTAFLIIEGFGYIKNNNQTGLQQLLSGLPSDEDIRNAKNRSVRVAEEDDDMEGIDEDGMESDGETGEPAPQEHRPRRVVEVDEEGWTTIVKR